MRNYRPSIFSCSNPYFSIVVFVSMSLLSGCASPAWPAKPEANFGFVLEFGSCSIDKLDTFTGEFTQDRVNEPDLTIPLELSTDQMQMTYEGMVEIDLASYPEEFKVPEPLFGEVVRTSSPFYYALQLENGSIKISIRWLDDLVEPTTPKADRLREWFDMIINMIYDHSAYQQLPKVNFGCI
jgi:hypothetical protein